MLSAVSTAPGISSGDVTEEVDVRPSAVNTIAEKMLDGDTLDSEDISFAVRLALRLILAEVTEDKDSRLLGRRSYPDDKLTSATDDSELMLSAASIASIVTTVSTVAVAVNAIVVSF